MVGKKAPYAKVLFRVDTSVVNVVDIFLFFVIVSAMNNELRNCFGAFSVRHTNPNNPC